MLSALNLRRLCFLCLVFYSTSFAKADPGDKGTVLARAWRVVDVIPIGQVECCGAGLEIDIPIGDFGGNVLPTPRIRIHEPGTGLKDTLIFDLEGFHSLLEAAEKVEALSKTGELVKAGSSSTMLPLESDGLFRFVGIARSNKRTSSQGAFLTYTREGEQVIGVGYDLNPGPGHTGWPTILNLLKNVEPAVKAYLLKKKPSKP